MVSKMAIENFSDSQGAGVCISPRTSFSHYLPQNDAVPVEHYIQSSSNNDFNFWILPKSSDQVHSSSADELFSDGKILPIQIEKRLSPPPPPPPPPPQIHKSAEPKVPISSKSSFWRFNRSASVNSANGYARTLFPLPPLSRSNSTGSNCSVDRSRNQMKQQKYSSPNSSLNQSSSNGHQKPPLKKSSYGYYPNGAKITPVLNVPPANMFGLGFMFSGGKDRSKRKK
ncbi:hypothetical protein CASFOL_037193 [Castilleja foliolosa]|uniref:Uncharacterized protein n=1 Tax=Castilleja foliolosa TaxID=1961234 RepID=A0ABD3BNF9_9LAMI